MITELYATLYFYWICITSLCCFQGEKRKRAKRKYIELSEAGSRRVDIHNGAVCKAATKSIIAEDRGAM